MSWFSIGILKFVNGVHVNEKSDIYFRQFKSLGKFNHDETRPSILVLIGF